MRGKKMAADLEECNLGVRILITLHLAERSGYGRCLVHLSRMLMYGEPYALFGDRI
jgi:hypothetical protein